MDSKLPLVAIVGRANVGKSSLFNRLVGSMQAIVAKEPGITRDPVYGLVKSAGSAFWLVDTAGLKDPADDFELSIQKQLAAASDAADLLLVTVEAGTIITEEDRRAARLALKSRKPVLLVINKSDRKSDEPADVWRRLGIKDLYSVSALHGQGIAELREAIAARIPKRVYKEDDRLKLAIVGRPNVGKSSIFNTLAAKQQAIVTPVAGATRDVNRLSVRYHTKTIELLDTGGIRRSGKIREIEKFSLLRTLQAISEADICLLIMDAGETAVKLDQKIAGLVSDAGKGLILVLNKWDLAEHSKEAAEARVANQFQFVWWAPLVFVSAVTGENVAKLMELAFEIEEQRTKKYDPDGLNDWLASAAASHPPSGTKNRQPRLNSVGQTGIRPPQFTIYGSGTDWLHWSYKRYLERDLRERYDIWGTPLVVKFFRSEGK